MTDRFAIHDRMSVTLRVLAQTKVPVFLLKGEKKKQVWDEMMAAKEDPRRWPAQTILGTGRASLVLNM
jgi:6-phosphogluconolactonase/glucosamine-6-phosphate isomerase/deaminase